MCDTAAWCCLHFPPELRDIVIDCLRHDTAALRACSLTCKAWLPRARHHLFHTAEIHPGRRGDNFKSLLLDTPELGQYIREVRISGVVQDPYGPDTILSGRWPTLTAVLGEPAGEVKTPELRSVDWLRSVLPTSTKLLARVTALKLFSFPITQPLAELLGGHFSRVHVVHLDACRAETFGHYLALPRALSHVHHLHMDGITWYRPTYPAAPMITRPCSLKSLSLAVKVDAATVINWLLDYRRHLALSSLSCYLASDASAIAVHKLLDAVGPGLRDFTVGFSDVRDPTVVLKNADFTLCPLTGLQRLHVQCISTTRFSTVPSLSWILIILSKTNSRHLTQLTISIAHSDLMAKLNLDGLSVILSHDRYAALRDLIFEVETRRERVDDAQERLNMRLSSLASKGVTIHVYPTHKSC